MPHKDKTRQELRDAESLDDALADAAPASEAAAGERAATPAKGFTRPDELKWTAMGEIKTMNTKEKSASFSYLIGGLAVGAVCGLLFAPKKGSDLREDILDWGNDKKERGQELLARAKEYIPHRVKS